MTSKYGGECAECGEKIDIGDEIFWDPDEKTITHKECYQDAMANAASVVKPVQAGTTVRMSNELIVRMVVQAISQRLNVRGQCKIISKGDGCECAKCQVERVDQKEVVKAVWGK